ncbi:MAG TPA: hypothetical protein VGD45_26875 [Steroidobacter sp.]|uniref:hypothetical protein n=1 Tax=Steroidobacter sp. TaxID=1978227 RepID=UPI002EDA37B7
MQHIAILKLKPTATEEDQAKLRHAEVAKVWELLVADSVRAIHFFSGSGRGAVLNIEAPDRAQADALVRQLPMVAAGLLDVEILTLTPFIGLQALFAEQR